VTVSLYVPAAAPLLLPPVITAAQISYDELARLCATPSVIGSSPALPSHDDLFEI
jgi:hypothetical protein